MNILLTGNLGYIGTVLTKCLIEKNYSVIGYDTNYYRGCALDTIPSVKKQITKDIRDLNTEDLQGIDAIIHLSALSNDPIGEFDPTLTEQINHAGTIKLATLAREAKVKRFVYASSQSMYGVSNTDDELDEDNSEKNPITAYARTKWEAECDLKKLVSDDFVITFMRPSTVFGASPMLRCDIIYNNLMGCAYTTGKIEIKSDGTPWRPVVHIQDVSSAFLAGLEAPKELVNGRSFNVGIPNGNFSVRQIAEAAQRAIPGCELIFTGEHGKDSRTYRVGFKRILTELSDFYKPQWDLDRGAKELLELFKRTGFKESHFRGYHCNRLVQIKKLVNEHQLDGKLRWIK